MQTPVRPHPADPQVALSPPPADAWAAVSEPDGPARRTPGGARRISGDERESDPAKVLWEPGSAGAVAGDVGLGLRGAWFGLVATALMLATVLQVRSGQNVGGYFAFSLALVLGAAAGLSDLSTRRVSNRLTYPAIVLALVLNIGLPYLLDAAGWNQALVWLGTPGPRQALLGFGLCAVVGVFGFTMRGLGGGDVKAMAALGALVGLDGALSMLANALLIAALLGVLNLASGGRFLSSLQAASFALYRRIVAGADRRRVLRFQANEGPFAFFLFLGLACAPFLRVQDLLPSLP